MSCDEEDLDVSVSWAENGPKMGLTDYITDCLNGVTFSTETRQFAVRFSVIRDVEWEIVKRV